MVYNIKIYDDFSGKTRIIPNAQYDSDKKTLICDGETTSSMETVIFALTKPNRFTTFLSKDTNDELSAAENDGLVYDMIESMEFSNLEKSSFVCTNLLSIGDNNCIVRVDHIVGRTANTYYYITKDGWNAIKNIVVIKQGERRNKIFDHNTLYVSAQEGVDIFKDYSTIIRNKNIFLKEKIDTRGIQPIQEICVYVLYQEKDYDMYGLYNTFVNSHIFYNDTEYITDGDGYVETEKHHPLQKHELMRVDEYGIIKEFKDVFINSEGTYVELHNGTIK